tara:strand:- start:1455 stop:2678 length:1224 start_codon:yes stop_codon:yes gene_type:complete
MSQNIKKEIRLNQAVIFCGGAGSRLGSITKIKPKPLIKINNIPFIDYVIKNLCRYKFKSILLLCGYKAYQFKKYNNLIIDDTKIQCINESTPLGNAGALLNAKKKLENYFLICNGDTYCDFNYLDLFTQMNKDEFIGAVGGLNVNKDFNKKFDNLIIKKNQLKKIKQKYKNHKIINSGYSIFNKDILKYISKNDESLEKQVFPKLILDNQLQAFSYNNRFIDMGTIPDLNYLKKNYKNLFVKKTIFLDRDGVINHDYNYVYNKKNFVWKKNLFKAVKYLNDKNYLVIVVTNQSGIGRGFYTKKHVEILHKYINEELKKKGAHIDDFYYAPYYKESKVFNFNVKDKFLRKPNIGMVKQAIKKRDINIKRSAIIGDSDTDMLLAKRLKIKGILVNDSSDILKIVKKNFK